MYYISSFCCVMASNPIATRQRARTLLRPPISHIFTRTMATKSCITGNRGRVVRKALRLVPCATKLNAIAPMTQTQTVVSWCTHNFVLPPLPILLLHHAPTIAVQLRYAHPMLQSGMRSNFPLSGGAHPLRDEAISVLCPDILFSTPNAMESRRSHFLH